MRPTEKKIEKYIKNRKVKTNPEVNKAVLNDLLDHLETAAPTQTAAPQPTIWRIIMENRIRLSSAAAAVLIAALVGISQLVFVTPTFAEIVEPILRAHTIAFDMIVGDSEDTSPVIHDRIKGPRIRRTISNVPGVVQIIDTMDSKMLSLADENGNKVAAYINIEGPIGEGTRFFHTFLRGTLGNLKDNPDFEPILLDKQTIDGHEVIGYAAESEATHIEVWADAKTSLPVRMEIQVGPQFYIIKNFEINLPIDDAEVSMEVPEGYTVRETTLDFSDAREEHLVESLRFWAEVLRDGTFPDSLTTEYYVKHMPLIKEKLTPRTDIPDADKEKMTADFIQGMIFLQMFELKQMEPWHYAGQGVALGDSETPIFWYRPKDAPNYRVIYGDLTTVETTPEALPQ
jgi:hypothetical protein